MEIGLKPSLAVQDMAQMRDEAGRLPDTHHLLGGAPLSAGPWLLMGSVAKWRLLRPVPAFTPALQLPARGIRHTGVMKWKSQHSSSRRVKKQFVSPLVGRHGQHFLAIIKCVT